MIGQEKLIRKISTLTLDTFPHSVLLLGDSGSGKKTLINTIIATQLNLDVFDITDNISLDTIYDIYLKSDPYIYMIDMRKLTSKKENAILKLVEEPLKNSYLILLDSDKNNILPTIYNRCQVWEMEPYSKDILKQFLTEDSYSLLEFCRTPGQIKMFQNQSSTVINDIDKTVDKIINVLGNSNFANILNISNRMNYKGEDNQKWNYDVFCRILILKVKDAYLQNKNEKLYNLFIETKKLQNNNLIPHINKQHLFENYLYNIKYILK